MTHIRLLLLIVIFSSPSVTVADAGTVTPMSTDRSHLLSFKSSLSSPSPLSDWDPLRTPDCCQWHGVTCSPSGHVTSLDLAITVTPSPSLPPLTGPFPAAVTNLTSLRHLSLKGNNFSGPIPLSITNLRNLKSLDLSFNSLAGDLPTDLLSMPSLQTLDLSFNRLSGEITVSQCTSLKHLVLSGNYFVGEIPPEIGRCANLETLLLAHNVLQGRIPAEIGELGALKVLDLSRNSLTDRIPREIGRCSELGMLLLTDLRGLEFNAFIGGIPPEVLGIPGLEVIWAPRSNLDGRLVRHSNSSCRLKVLNLGLNYIRGWFPQWLKECTNLQFLDLSSNFLEGMVPQGISVGCMSYFNVSKNSIFGSLWGLAEGNCTKSPIYESKEESFAMAYTRNLMQSWSSSNEFSSVLGEENVVLHDLSWNNFSGSLPSLSFGFARNFSYGLFLNDNGFNESTPHDFFRSCGAVNGFAVNLSNNQIPGKIEFLSSCLKLKSFEAANNKLGGSIPSNIGSLSLLSHLDLRGNHMNGSIPNQLGKIKNLENVLLGENKLTGEIPSQIGEMTSLKLLDLSTNTLSGNIPLSLSDASKIEVLLLDHNLLSGEIPQSFSTLTSLSTLNVSYNNLSGEIPHIMHSISCDCFRGNKFLQPCPDLKPEPSNHTEPSKVSTQKNKLKSFMVAALVSASVVVFVLVILVFVLITGKRKLVRLSSLKEKVVVIFSNAPAEIDYESVVKATGNFSIQNLIGSGGFGATYKAELVPGFLVAVKRLSVGRFQGLQQFDAEIRTLGRIRHKNLVTLIGYHMGEVDTFLIYNYLPGGNLEAFIRKMPNSNIGWSVIHKIALDVGQALTYLHYSCVPRIVHRDIKPSNILLDDKLNAYLSDFGLAKLLEVSETHATTDVAGTFGYVAPEYATTCRVSNKADVYSYGVVLLELMSGKRSLDSSFSKYGNGFTIVAWGRLLIQEGKVSEFFCGSLWEDGPKENLVAMLRLALSCTVESLSVRPSMRQVVERLKQLKT